jgi:hypothetical protein
MTCIDRRAADLWHAEVKPGVAPQGCGEWRGICRPCESGNDMPLLLSTTRAERVAGGYRFTGHKSFGSLTPVWTYRYPRHDSSDPAAPKIIHAFMPRDTKGYAIKETWDVLGMRATRSDDTVLEGAFVPDKYIGRVVSAGAAGIDRFVLGIFAWALLVFGNIYYSLAQRALDWTIDNIRVKTSLALSLHGVSRRGPTCSRRDGHELEAIGPHIEKVAQDWSTGVDYVHGWGEDRCRQIPSGRRRMESR